MPATPAPAPSTTVVALRVAYAWGWPNTYGIGYTRAVLHSNPQTPIRAYEVETVTAAGQHRYVVAIDISAAQHG